MGLKTHHIVVPIDTIHHILYNLLRSCHGSPFVVGRGWRSRIPPTRMYLYLAVTADKYELPLGVYDSLAVMAREWGVSRETVRSAIRRNQDGRHTGRKFIRVEVS